MNSVNLGWLVFYYYGKLFFLKVGDWCPRRNTQQYKLVMVESPDTNGSGALADFS